MSTEVIVISSIYVLPSNNFTDFPDWGPMTQISKPPANACIQWLTLMYFHLEQWKGKFAHCLLIAVWLERWGTNRVSWLKNKNNIKQVFCWVCSSRQTCSSSHSVSSYHEQHSKWEWNVSLVKKEKLSCFHKYSRAIQQSHKSSERKPTSMRLAVDNHCRVRQSIC